MSTFLPIETGRRALYKGSEGCFFSERTDFLADILDNGRILRFRVTGRSMHPTIRSGDYVVLRKPDIDTLKLGDLLLCRQAGNRMALHRLIAVGRDSTGNICRLITKGDSLDIPDPPMGVGAILGRVITIERHMDRRKLLKRMDTRLSAGTNLLSGLYHRIRSDVICAAIRFKAGRKSDRERLSVGPLNRRDRKDAV